MVLSIHAGERGSAITGVGFTDFTRDSGVAVLDLAVEACLRAIEDSGMRIGDIDGIISHNFNGDSVGTSAVATALGVTRLGYSLDLSLGGQAPSLAVIHAALALQSGMAKNVLVFRALNGRSGYRVGRETFAAPTAQFRYPSGMTAYAQGVAMWARRYLAETGGADADLGEVPIAQRRYALLNERAARRTPLTRESYDSAPLIIDPFKAADCTVEVDGGCALLVTRLERARDLLHRPVSILGGAWISMSRPGMDVSDVFGPPDITRNFTSALADDQIYDCFSSTVLFGLEGLGFVGRGEAPSFIASGATALTGSLPVNTNGGMLAEGYLHGMNTIAEAVLQIQGRGQERQLARADTGVVTSGALTDGSAIVLAGGER